MDEVLRLQLREAVLLKEASLNVYRKFSPEEAAAKFQEILLGGRDISKSEKMAISEVWKYLEPYIRANSSLSPKGELKDFIELVPGAILKIIAEEVSLSSIHNNLMKKMNFNGVALAWERFRKWNELNMDLEPGNAQKQTKDSGLRSGVDILSEHSTAKDNLFAALLGLAKTPEQKAQVTDIGKIDKSEDFKYAVEKF